MSAIFILKGEKKGEKGKGEKRESIEELHGAAIDVQNRVPVARSVFLSVLSWGGKKEREEGGKGEGTHTTGYSPHALLTRGLDCVNMRTRNVF